MYPTFLPRRVLLCLGLLLFLTVFPAAAAHHGLDFEHLAALRSVGEVAVSPDGDLIAYTLTVPRTPGVDDNGSAWRELHIVDLDGKSRGWITGEQSVRGLSFTPDGHYITYLSRRHGDDQTSLWALPLAGGESRRLLTSETGIQSYEISQDGKSVVYLASEEEDKARSKREKQGYTEDVFEERWRDNQIWITEMPPFTSPVENPKTKESKAKESDAEGEDEAEDGPREIPIDGGVPVSFALSPNGAQLAVQTVPRNLIDDRLQRMSARMVRVEDGETVAEYDLPGKQGSLHWSPDGKHLAMIGPEDQSDAAPGRLVLLSPEGGEGKDLMPGAELHVRSFEWHDASTLVWVADEGSETVLATVGVDGKKTQLLKSAGKETPALRSVLVSKKGLVLRGESPRHPGEIFYLGEGEKQTRRLTNSNPWLEDVAMAKQEVVRWKASDGEEIEGILIHPLEGDGPAPLLLMVHGGPESNDRNGWVTNYSRPGQIAAARGYAVLYPNYRGSTGRGVKFAKISQGDPAGGEFRDLVEAIDYLASIDVADSDRVGITGGSYGGYATAWGSTFYTERFRAGVMFVGVSNFLSKTFTTDIPVENIEVHTLTEPWKKFEKNLERSPLFYVEKARTPLLIAGGTGDTRVHPSQSLQLYRALDLVGKTPVRYVRYPGEPHGNRRAASQDDYVRRLMRWMDHFVVGGNTELPPVEIFEEEEKEEGEKEEPKDAEK